MRLSFCCVVAAALCCPALNCAQTARHAEVMDHYHRAEAALAKGDIDAAAAEFREILRIDPANTSAEANLGALAYKRGDYASAKQSFTVVLQRDPSLWDAKALLGLSERALGESATATPLLAEAFPHVRDPGVKIDTGIALLHDHEQDHTLGDAAGIAHALELAAPGNPEVLYVVYRTYSELAADALHTLTVAAPNSGRLHQVLAEAALTQDDFPAAIVELRKAIAADPTLPGVHYELGTTLLTNAQDAASRTEAEQAFMAELGLNSHDARSTFELGEIARLKNDLPRAQENYQAALRLAPDDAQAHLALGSLLLEQGKASEAVVELQKASRLDPANETPHYRLARALRSLGRAAEADQEMAAFRRIHDASRVSAAPAAPPH